MAIYQTVIFYIPFSWGVNEDEVKKLFTEEGYFNSESIWMNYHEGANPLQVINSTFGTEKETFWEYGGANDISIDLDENGNIQCIRARVDGRDYSTGDLKRILSLAHVLECNLFIPEFKKYIKPDREAIESLTFLLNRSRAAGYVKS